jgi:hypothetical protein
VKGTNPTPRSRRGGPCHQMGRAASTLHDAGNHRTTRRRSQRQPATHRSLIRRSNPPSSPTPAPHVGTQSSLSGPDRGSRPASQVDRQGGCATSNASRNGKPPRCQRTSVSGLKNDRGSEQGGEQPIEIFGSRSHEMRPDGANDHAAARSAVANVRPSSRTISQPWRAASTQAALKLGITIGLARQRLFAHSLCGQGRG